MWIDIQAEKPDSQLSILIEVKGFENMRSPIAYLQSVVGQYVLYQTVLQYLEWEHPLYLALPDDIENDILSEAIGQEVIRATNMKLMRFSVELEEIIQWIT